MNERIKEIRKALGLTQKAFGESIELSESSISKIEKGSTLVTDRVLNSICRKFDVNEEWLRNGKGDMFIQHQYDEQIKEYLKDVSEGKAPILEDIMRVYFSLPPEGQRVFNEFVVNLSKEVSRDFRAIALANAHPAAQDQDTLSEEDQEEIDKLVEGFRRELVAEKSIPEESLA